MTDENTDNTKDKTEKDEVSNNFDWSSSGTWADHEEWQKKRISIYKSG